MGRLVLHTAAEQVAAHLRGEILRGVWSGAMPGGDRLAAELGIGCNTAEAALAMLEKEGFLESQGLRRGRIVVARPGIPELPCLRIAILFSEAANAGLDYIVEIRHELTKAGHICTTAPKTMEDLGMDAGRIRRMVGETEADAWLVCSGSDETRNGRKHPETNVDLRFIFPFWLNPDSEAGATKDTRYTELPMKNPNRPAARNRLFRRRIYGEWSPMVSE